MVETKMHFARNVKFWRKRNERFFFVAANRTPNACICEQRLYWILWLFYKYAINGRVNITVGCNSKYFDNNISREIKQITEWYGRMESFDFIRYFHQIASSCMKWASLGCMIYLDCAVAVLSCGIQLNLSINSSWPQFNEWIFQNHQFHRMSMINNDWPRLIQSIHHGVEHILVPLSIKFLGKIQHWCWFYLMAQRISIAAHNSNWNGWNLMDERPKMNSRENINSIELWIHTMDKDAELKAW